MTNCECGTKIEEFEGHKFCPRCDMVPGSWEEAFVNSILRLLELSNNAEIEAIQPLRVVASIKMHDSQCKGMGVEYGDTDSYLRALSGLPFKNKDKEGV